MPPLSRAEKSRLIEKMCSYIPHSMLQGIRLEQVDGEEVTMRLPYRPELVGNPESGAIHSGALTVLLDHTLGTAGICCNAVGAMITPTLDLRIDHLRVAPAGRDILATAGVYRVTRRILFVEGFAWCESRDKPIARATGSWVLMPELDLGALFKGSDAGAQQQ
ncbi:MAG: PaaI family thioesterase [Halieaceae bacterium]|nr:PaaI family thioesterase [Halieaceae bacterium]